MDLHTFIYIEGASGYHTGEAFICVARVVSAGCMCCLTFNLIYLILDTPSVGAERKSFRHEHCNLSAFTF